MQTPVRHNFVAATAFAVCLFSAAITAFIFYMIRDLAHYAETVPAHVFEGGNGFSHCAPYWFAAFVGIVVGFLAFSLLMASILTHWRAHFFHVSSFVLLLPFFYLLYRVIAVFFR